VHIFGTLDQGGVLGGQEILPAVVKVDMDITAVPSVRGLV
jgi:hypothetical protein